MIRLHKLICTCLGIGYVKGGGTFAALACCIIWYCVFRDVYGNLFLIILTIIITGVGIWSAGKLESVWGKDSNKVVIDEVAGMSVGLLFVPFKLKYFLTALILFRFFDIAKPLLIRRLEKLPLGWGVMADDLLAGIYTNLIMQTIILSNLF